MGIVEDWNATSNKLLAKYKPLARYAIAIENAFKEKENTLKELGMLEMVIKTLGGWIAGCTDAEGRRNYLSDLLMLIAEIDKYDSYLKGMKDRGKSYSKEITTEEQAQDCRSQIEQILKELDSNIKALDKSIRTIILLIGAYVLDTGVKRAFQMFLGSLDKPDSPVYFCQRFSMQMAVREMLISKLVPRKAESSEAYKSFQDFCEKIYKTKEEQKEMVQTFEKLNSALFRAGTATDKHTRQTDLDSYIATLRTMLQREINDFLAFHTEILEGGSKFDRTKSKDKTIESQKEIRNTLEDLNSNLYRAKANPATHKECQVALDSYIRELHKRLQRCIDDLLSFHTRVLDQDSKLDATDKKATGFLIDFETKFDGFCGKSYKKGGKLKVFDTKKEPEKYRELIDDLFVAELRKLAEFKR